MKNTITLITALLMALASFAQGRGINYKAVIKDNSGNVLANQNMKVRFTIRNSKGSNIHVDTHTTTSNTNGIIILNIGEGTPGQFQDFNTIDWGDDNYTLVVGIDPEMDGTYINFEETEFKSVPYALHAEKATLAENVIVENLSIGIDDLLDGKSDANSTSIFLGENAGLLDDETDNNNIGIGANALNLNTSGSINVAIGSSALRSNTIGSGNTASGYYALGDNTTASSNSAFGFFALRYNTTGFGNVAMGSAALLSNTIGKKNAAIGTNALSSNTEGNENSAIGYQSLEFNTTGSQNTATGSEALKNNTTGSQNTATGYNALSYNTTGYSNTATGNNALSSNTTGIGNTAIGHIALNFNSEGSGNTAIGSQTLQYNIDGDNNTAIGASALFLNMTGNYNTAIGTRALSSNRRGWYHTAIGYQALSEVYSSSTTYVTTNNIGIGYEAEVPNSNFSNQVRIGNTEITYAGIQVGWTVTSDKRWKENIRELPYGLKLVKQLKPVDYIRKNNENKTREMGFVAQDLEALLTKVGYTDQGFLTKDDNGYLSVRYNDLIALLTKALQEQQVIIEAQNSKLTTQDSKIENLTAEIGQFKTLDLRVKQLENSLKTTAQ